MYYVYIIKGNSGIFYKGITSNLEKRIHQHESGQCNTTKKMSSFELVFVQVCDNRQDARKLEKYLKSGAGREIIDEIV